MEVRMKKLLLSLCLIMITPVVLADAQQEAMEATFAAATDSSIDTVFEIYQTYYDPVDDETYSIVGYDSLEDIVFKDNLVTKLHCYTVIQTFLVSIKAVMFILLLKMARQHTAKSIQKNVCKRN